MRMDRNIGLSRYEVLERRARAARAEAMARLLTAGAKGLGSAVALTWRVLRGWVGGVANAIEQDRRRRIALRELEAMDDRLLADIGLSRSQIRAAVSGLLEIRTEGGDDRLSDGANVVPMTKKAPVSDREGVRRVA